LPSFYPTNPVEFIGNNIPPYAILSHAWEEGEEVTLPEICLHSVEIQQKKVYEKIAKTCKIAREQGLNYALVDTCCTAL
jgi:hypothetical protein